MAAWGGTSTRGRVTRTAALPRPRAGKKGKREIARIFQTRSCTPVLVVGKKMLGERLELWVFSDELAAKGTGLTPVDTRWQGFSGATGVTENAKTPGFPGVFRVLIH